MRQGVAFALVSLLSLVIFVAVAASAESPNVVELQIGWRMSAASHVSQDESQVSQPQFDVSQWYAVGHMPATVLQVLQENGVYKNLYYGMNLATPGELWKQDWWYRTTFTAPAS